GSHMPQTPRVTVTGVEISVSTVVVVGARAARSRDRRLRLVFERGFALNSVEGEAQLLLAVEAVVALHGGEADAKKQRVSVREQADVAETLSEVHRRSL